MDRASIPSPGDMDHLSSAERKAKRKDDRGRRVGTNVRDYERMCGSGPDRLAETLIARHNVRMKNTEKLPDGFRFEAILFLAPIAILDIAHRKLNLTLDRAPSAYYGKWPHDLGWGVDSCVAATRLLLAGQVVAAATIARQQLERWTAVMAPVVGVEQHPSEKVEDFIARAWTAYAERMPNPGAPPESSNIEGDADPTTAQDIEGDDSSASTEEPTAPHKHVVLANGREVCPAVVYGVLSEIMHARLFEEAMWWESAALLSRFDVPSVVYGAVDCIADALSLSLTQIQYMTAAGLYRQGDPEDAVTLIASINLAVRPSADVAGEEPPDDALPYSSSFVLPRLPTVMPLSPDEGLLPVFVRYLDDQRSTYESLAWNHRPAGRLYRDDELATLAFGAHRQASASFALRALAAERDELGDDFNIDSVASRGTNYIVVAELAALAALWTRNGPLIPAASTPLALVSSTLRSAYWLWLEDDDRAMASLRCTLEQIARSRVHRTKPAKAERLEESVHNKPQRWIEAAGWGRLSAWNRVLGAYAHAHKKPNWEGARELLKDLQLDADEPYALQRARGDALNVVTTLVAHESISILALFSQKVAATAAELLENHSGLDMTREWMDALMSNALAHRKTPITEQD
ncbi:MULTISPECIES: hypothetical protein [Nocardiaceae]|uniref:hypothetical protein n=1 Tax=Nocardiaceae TaxID=85025 RepID=UPI00050C1321|nr:MULTISPECIES: hypothetical protein [Rhodococcus]OZC70960.1 hypothetical protein CH276_00415 [Rhodococcus sp. 06-470-2]OZD10588.1 hypothetical protein CH281_00810 [Rhodococcus sp. 06-221-2]OZD47967.1 hypothetical protein CH264_07555 [Rhodococcus sp. 06-1477-1A]OZD69465.1 hypothetical protein CH271_09430 [Rhodococcus sp. 05-340-2]OZE13267.1 hypothetical protein CH249_07980 [Rhodococcus sp. 05-2255-3B1]